MSHRRISLSLTIFAMIFAVTGIGRAQVISTLSGGSVAGNGGLGVNSGWGQTFQTPDGVAKALDQFAIRVVTGQATSFEAFIFEWTASLGETSFVVPTSPAALKWSSGSGTGTADSGGLVTFDTGHLALDAATSYAFYIATSADYGSLPVLYGNTYYGDTYVSGGAFTWTGNSLMPTNGDNYTGLYDLQFEATFSALAISPVPEPATYATIGLAVCGVLALVVRRRRELPAAPLPAAAA